MKTFWYFFPIPFMVVFCITNFLFIKNPKMFFISFGLWSVFTYWLVANMVIKARSISKWSN